MILKKKPNFLLLGSFNSDLNFIIPIFVIYSPNYVKKLYGTFNLNQTDMNRNPKDFESVALDLKTLTSLIFKNGVNVFFKISKNITYEC